MKVGSMQGERETDTRRRQIGDSSQEKANSRVSSRSIDGLRRRLAARCDLVDPPEESHVLLAPDGRLRARVAALAHRRDDRLPPRLRAAKRSNTRSHASHGGARFAAHRPRADSNHRTLSGG
eukprot:4810419-Pleurochrysis_carterae.AAC.4